MERGDEALNSPVVDRLFEPFTALQRLKMSAPRGAPQSSIKPGSATTADSVKKTDQPTAWARKPAAAGT